MHPKFSKRTAWDLQETAYAAALQQAKKQPQAIFDLTASNPTACGLLAEASLWAESLGSAASSVYDPDPRGLRSARQAVAAYYKEQTGTTLDAEQLVLTTSTSEAYSFLFRLLCDHDDEVLIAQPSYPLFEFLAELEDVRLVAYPLFYDHGWHIDMAALRASVTPRTRAILVVQPNNPTGHFTKAAEREELEQICAEHGLALIVDEVFLDYGLDRSSSTLRKSESFMAGDAPVLTFVLSGLSKISALPQMKVAWIAAKGPEEVLREALARLEVVADTFLSMNAPIQHAVPGMLAARHGVQQKIIERVQGNLAEMDWQIGRQTLISRLVVEAGWYAVLRVPALGSANAAAVRLLETEQVLVHPGNFYGLADAGWLVVSLLPPTEIFQEGLARLVRFFEAEK